VGLGLGIPSEHHYCTNHSVAAQPLELVYPVKNTSANRERRWRKPSKPKDLRSNVWAKSAHFGGVMCYHYGVRGFVVRKRQTGYAVRAVFYPDNLTDGGHGCVSLGGYGGTEVVPTVW
jgi:hypothetical protein